MKQACTPKKKNIRNLLVDFVQTCTWEPQQLATLAFGRTVSLELSTAKIYLWALLCLKTPSFLPRWVMNNANRIASLHIFTYLYVSLRIFTYFYVSLGIFTYLYVSLRIFTHLYLSLYTHLYVSLPLAWFWWADSQRMRTKLHSSTGEIQAFQQICAARMPAGKIPPLHSTVSSMSPRHEWARGKKTEEHLEFGILAYRFHAAHCSTHQA